MNKRNVGAWCFSATHEWPDGGVGEHVVYHGCKTRAEAEEWAAELRKSGIFTGKVVWTSVPAPTKGMKS